MRINLLITMTCGALLLVGAGCGQQPSLPANVSPVDESAVSMPTDEALPYEVSSEVPDSPDAAVDAIIDDLLAESEAMTDDSNDAADVTADAADVDAFVNQDLDYE